MRFLVSGTVFAREDFFFEVEGDALDEARNDAASQAVEGFEAQDFEVEFDEFELIEEEE